MADIHESPASMTTHEEHHPHPNYIAVFAMLVVLTAVSFWTVAADYWLERPGAAHTLVMVVAVAKAVLVAMFFMHLKFDWFKVYMMIVPALILGTIAVCALLPDMVFGDTRLQLNLPFLQE